MIDSIKLDFSAEPKILTSFFDNKYSPSIFDIMSSLIERKSFNSFNNWGSGLFEILFSKADISLSRVFKKSWFNDFTWFSFSLSEREELFIISFILTPYIGLKPSIIADFSFSVRGWLIPKRVASRLRIEDSKSPLTVSKSPNFAFCCGELSFCSSLVISEDIFDSNPRSNFCNSSNFSTSDKLELDWTAFSWAL